MSLVLTQKSLEKFFWLFLTCAAASMFSAKRVSPFCAVLGLLLGAGEFPSAVSVVQK